jgi:hypothetical protein
MAPSAPRDGDKLAAGDPVLRVELVQLGIGVVDGVNDVEQYTGAAGRGQQLEVVGSQIHKGEDLLALLAV